MPSSNYRIARKAIENEQQITCRYEGCYRELCPHIIGWTKGDEKLLAWQFGGETNSILPPGGMWRCIFLSRVSDVNVRNGRWHTGSYHRAEQTCVQQIDLDINVHVRVGVR